MKMLFYPIILCFMVVQLLPLNSHAETDLRDVLFDYLNKIRKEYSYYATLNDDGNDFPAAREQEFLIYIENDFLKEHADDVLLKQTNIVASAPSIAIAKLFLHYGGNVWEGGEYDFFPIIFASIKGSRYRELSRNLSHAEVIDIVNQGERKWANHLPSNNSIALIKLYLALGADIYAVKKSYGANYNAIIASLYEYFVPYERRSYDIRPSYTHRADDLEPPYIPEAEADEAIYYYRSPAPIG